MNSTQGESQLIPCQGIRPSSAPPNHSLCDHGHVTPGPHLACFPMKKEGVGQVVHGGPFQPQRPALTSLRDSENLVFLAQAAAEPDLSLGHSLELGCPLGMPRGLRQEDEIPPPTLHGGEGTGQAVEGPGTCAGGAHRAVIPGQKGQLGPRQWLWGKEGQKDKEDLVAQHGGGGRGSQGCQRLLAGDQEEGLSLITTVTVTASWVPGALHTCL